MNRILKKGNRLLFKLLNLLLAITLLTASIPTMPTSAQVVKAQPVLLQLASTEPDEVVRVIVQKLTKSNHLEELVTQLGGTVTRDLHIINAFVAELPAKAISTLASDSDVRWVSLDAQVIEVSGITQDTITLQEDFDVVSYKANFAGGTWPSQWVELGEADGPETGNVRIVRFHGGDSQGVMLQNVNSGIQSSISLANTANANLTVAYKRKGFEPGDSVQIAISATGGSDWTEVARLSGTTDAEIVSSTFDISQFASEQTVIRFSASFVPESQARFYVDSVQLVPTLYNDDSENTGEQMYLPFVSMADNSSSLNSGSAEAASVSATESVRDEFQSVSFGNNDGSVDWLGNWTEIGETDGPGNGDVRISSINNDSEHVLRIRDGRRGVERSVDLNDATSATLNLKYRRRGLGSDSDYVKIELSSDGGNTWTEIDRISGPENDSQLQPASYDISAHVGSVVVIRLRSSRDMDNSRDGITDRIYFDDLEIVYSPSAQTINHSDLQYSDASESFASDSQLQTGIVSDTASLAFTNDFTGTIGIVRDEFTNSAFNNNDGNVAWLGDWIEVDEQISGPRGGAVSIAHGSLFFNRFWYEGADPSVTRSIAFPRDVVSATLSFDFVTSKGVDSTDAVAIEISNDGGANYKEISSIVGISGSMTDTVSVDVSDYVSVNTTVRIRVVENYSAFWEFIGIDNFQVAYEINDCANCIETKNLNNRFVEIIGADRLWNGIKPIQGRDVGVAVIDTGIAKHSDLENEAGLSRIVSKVQFNSVAGLIDDYYGHGSHIAGAIGGNGSLSTGNYIGVAPKANLVDVKVVDDQGKGTTADVIAGLQWVLENKDTHNIRVVNLSLSSTVAESYLTNPLNAAIEILWFNSVVVVVSAGNTGGGTIYPPANDPFAITVGAMDDNGTLDTSDDFLASYSAFGMTEDNFSKPDIVAPGTNIISLLSSDDSSLAFAHPAHRLFGVDGNHYFRMSGTSMASAITTGAVALLLDDEPHLTPDQVKYRLMSTAAPAAYPAPGATGAGYLDIYAAVHGTSTESANTNIPANQLLWTGSEPINWDSVNWDSVNWDSVNWDSVNWDSVNWDSVNWDSVKWDD